MLNLVCYHIRDENVLRRSLENAYCIASQLAQRQRTG